MTWEASCTDMWLQEALGELVPLFLKKKNTSGWPEIIAARELLNVLQNFNTNICMNNHRNPVWSCWHHWRLKVMCLTAPLMPLMEVLPWDRWSRGPDPTPRAGTGRNHLNAHLSPLKRDQEGCATTHLRKENETPEWEPCEGETAFPLPNHIFKKLKQNLMVRSHSRTTKPMNLNHGYLTEKRLWCCLGPPSSSAQWMALMTKGTLKTLGWGSLH